MFDVVELIGYAGTALTIASYAMRRTTWLRIAGVGSSVAFLIYGYLVESYPVMLMEAILLPLNLARLLELRRFVGAVSKADGSGGDFAWVLPFATRRSYAPGATVVLEGRMADHLRVVISGTLVCPAGARIVAGSLAGDATPFGEARRESRSLVALDVVEIAALPCAMLHELYFQNPLFSYRLTRLVLEEASRREAMRPTAIVLPVSSRMPVSEMG